MDIRADSRLVTSQWEMSFQSNAVSPWLGANLESALDKLGCDSRCFWIYVKLEQLERLRSEDTPRRPVITHTIDQFVLNPKSILLTSSYRIPSQKKVKAEKIRKISEKFKF